MQHLLSVLGGVTLAAICQAQATWVKMTPTNSPPSRTYATMAYDVARGKTVLFGGAQKNDTWEWDGKNWTLVNTTAAPPARGGHTMAYDFLTQRCVVLGGTPNGAWNSVMAGTWQYDGKTWAQATITTEPAARSQHAMCHDSALLKTLLFGGGNSGATRLNDTWTWDGKVWTQLNPQTSPPARYWHAMSEDTTRKRVVMFGGSATGYVNDTWEWDGQNWAQITTTAAPSARGAHAMAYDSARQRTVLFGGTGAGGAETWEYIASQPLTADVSTVSIATGGTQTFTLNAGGQNGSRLYWLFGSLTGTTPGVTLVSAVGSVTIPLVPDLYTNITIAVPNSTYLVKTKGALDISGKAQAAFVVPKINDAGAIGLTFYHAGLVYDANNNFYLASNPVSLRLVQ